MAGRARPGTPRISDRISVSRARSRAPGHYRQGPWFSFPSKYSGGEVHLHLARVCERHSSRDTGPRPSLQPGTAHEIISRVVLPSELDSVELYAVDIRDRWRTQD